VYLRIAIVAVIAVVLAGSHWKAYTTGAKIERVEWQAKEAKSRAEAEEQTQRNRDLQRSAELRYTVRAGVRDRFITETIREVRHESESLRACPVSEPLRLRLNAAAACARDDSASACGADIEVPATR